MNIAFLRVFIAAALAWFGSRAVAGPAPGAGDELERAYYADDDFFKDLPVMRFGHDPFAQPLTGYREISNASIKLDGVIFSPENPAAVVDGQVVKKGTKLKSGAHVRDIGIDYVVIEDNGHLKQVSMHPIHTEEKKDKEKEATPRAPASLNDLIQGMPPGLNMGTPAQLGPGLTPPMGTGQKNEH